MCLSANEADDSKSKTPPGALRGLSARPGLREEKHLPHPRQRVIKARYGQGCASPGTPFIVTMKRCHDEPGSRPLTSPRTNEGMKKNRPRAALFRRARLRSPAVRSWMQSRVPPNTNAKAGQQKARLVAGLLGLAGYYGGGKN